MSKARVLAAFLTVALLSFTIIDLGNLIYEHRVKKYVFSFLSSKLVSPLAVGSPNVCENDSWWFNSSGGGSKPWQRILQEEKEFPLAYTIMAFERPDQVSPCKYLSLYFPSFNINSH